MRNLIHRRRTPEGDRIVVHPLDDVPEAKHDVSRLGRIPMTPAVRWSLIALRGYLILMTLLVLFHVLDVTGAFH